jgi:ABC-2 type transport system ATP-binding protein
MASVITIKSLKVVLGHGFVALDDVNVELSAGKIIGLIGPSGAGKTTLVRAIVGRQRVRNGELNVFGYPAGSASLRSRLGYMTQEDAIYDDLTVNENIRYFAIMSGMSGQLATAETFKILKIIDLSDKANSLVRDLSGGQMRRVSLASALVADPDLLVLDEPTVGLDPVLRESIWRLLRQWRDAGKTIIITSHVMEEAERCDDLLLVRSGRVIAHDTPEHLREQTGSETVEQSFLKLVEATV